MDLRNLRRLFLGAALSLAVAAALDLSLTVFALRDGEFLGRPVPPYGDVREPRWQRWAKGRLEALDSGRPPTQVLMTDPELGWRNLPGFRSPDGKQCFDERGRRGTKARAPRPADGVLRVALFGESFVYGEEVDDGDEFGAQLEALDPSIEVLNYGVSGYGTDQALMLARRELAASGAEVACVGVMLENIVRNVSRFTRLRNPYLKGLGIKPRFVLADGALEPVPIPFASERELCLAVLDGSLASRVREHDMFAELDYDSPLWQSGLARLWIGYRGSRARDYRLAWPAAEASATEQGEPFQLLVAILAAFDAEARAAGARRSLVLVFPPREDLARVVAGETPFWGALARELDRRGIPVFDLAGPLAARARELRRPEDDDVRAAYRVFLRAHLNRDGNGVVARALAERLRSP